MKKAITLFVVIFLAGKLTRAQNEFSGCTDTLLSQLSNSNKVIEGNVLSDWEDCIKGKRMPYLSLKTITGEKIETKNLAGKILVINLWFTACHPCMAELPALNRLVKEYKGKDVVFLGLSTDTRENLESDFFPKYKLDFTIIPDARDMIREIGRTGFPTTYIVDKKGYIQSGWCGGYPDEIAETAVYARAKPIIDELLGR
jgi:thiol-disulfide isomerase/thioredoxin